MENDNDNNTESPHNADDVVAPEVDPELDLEELAEADPPAGAAVAENLENSESSENFDDYDPANAGDVIGPAPDDRSWLSRLGSGMASGISNTGRFLWDIPGRMTRPQLPQLRGAIPDPPLGARQVSPGYADDLWQARPTIDRPYPVIGLSKEKCVRMPP